MRLESKRTTPPFRNAHTHTPHVEEIIAEYSPFKDMVSDIDAALTEEHSAMLSKKREEEQPSGTTPQPQQGTGDAIGMESDTVPVVGAAFFDESSLSVDALKRAHARRVMSSFLVLEVEGGQSQTQLATALSKHALVKATFWDREACVSCSNCHVILRLANQKRCLRIYICRSLRLERQSPDPFVHVLNPLDDMRLRWGPDMYVLP